MTFVTWTRFELPDDVLFNIGVRCHVRPEYDSRLTDAVRLLLHAPDHVLSTWGRVSERPEEIILVSSWKFEDSFIAFKAMPEYLQYWTSLSDISSVAPVEQRIGSTFSWPSRLRGKIDIFSISFPSPVSDITRAQLRELKGLQKSGSVGLGKSHLAPYSFPPTKLWLQGTQEVEGTEVETMLYICWWGGLKREKDFKEYVLPWDPRTRLDKFEQNARSAGATHIREEHCDFVEIYKRAI